MAKLERRRPRWLPGLAVLLALVLAGCGPSGTDGGQHQEHAAQPAHDMEAMGIQPIEATGARAPRLTLTATPDSMGGFNLRVGMANFRLAPEHTPATGRSPARGTCTCTSTGPSTPGSTAAGSTWTGSPPGPIPCGSRRWPTTTPPTTPTASRCSPSPPSRRADPAGAADP